ncbi:MAG: hypothetical protein GX654_05960 [Desulfatiglans sp.]|nr:hypothetical protein [Desulfatiglans sp.]
MTNKLKMIDLEPLEVNGKVLFKSKSDTLSSTHSVIKSESDQKDPLLEKTATQKRAPGRPIGSGKSRLDSVKEEIFHLLDNGSTKVFISKKYNITPQAFHNWLNKVGRGNREQGL